jgi:hypothetical protein
MAKNHIGEAVAISSNNKLKSILPKFDGLRLDAQMPQPAARSRQQPGDLRCEGADGGAHCVSKHGFNSPRLIRARRQNQRPAGWNDARSCAIY